MGVINVLDHQIEGSLSSFNCVSKLKNQVGTRTELEDGKLIALHEGAHAEQHKEIVRLRKSIGLEMDVADPYRGPVVRSCH
jgi:hypothetical protein